MGRLIYMKPTGCTDTLLDALLRDFNQQLNLNKKPIPQGKAEFMLVFMRGCLGHSLAHWHLSITLGEHYKAFVFWLIFPPASQEHGFTCLGTHQSEKVPLNLLTHSLLTISYLFKHSTTKISLRVPLRAIPANHSMQSIRSKCQLVHSQHNPKVERRAPPL